MTVNRSNFNTNINFITWTPGRTGHNAHKFKMDSTVFGKISGCPGQSPSGDLCFYVRLSDFAVFSRLDGFFLNCKTRISFLSEASRYS